MTYLLDLCQGQEPGFASVRERAETLAPYAIEIRYPGAVMEFSQQEAEEALAIAEMMWDFVLRLLPDETHP